MDQASILICDDSIHEIRVIVSVLKSAQYRLIIAQDGRQACDRAGLLLPDLILMDVRMPGLDGFAACRLLKADPETRHIPIIFLTAANDLDDRLEGLRAGAVDYIVKPANEQEVLLRVAAHTARQGSSPPELAQTRIPRPGARLGSLATVQAFIRLLNEGNDAELSLDRMAAKLGTSRAGLADAFRATLGVSLVNWLRDQRLKRACLWLARSNLPISQIATELAYTSSGNFATAFRDRYGITPREFRKLIHSDPRSHQEHLQPAPYDLSVQATPWPLLLRAVNNTNT